MCQDCILFLMDLWIIYPCVCFFIPQIFLGQQTPSSSTSTAYSPSLSHSGTGSYLHSGSTGTTLPFSRHLNRQQPRREPFHTSPGARGAPSLSVHTDHMEITGHYYNSLLFSCKQTYRVAFSPHWSSVTQKAESARCRMVSLLQTHSSLIEEQALSS